MSTQQDPPESSSVRRLEVDSGHERHEATLLRWCQQREGVCVEHRTKVDAAQDGVGRLQVYVAFLTLGQLGSSGQLATRPKRTDRGVAYIGLGIWSHAL